MIVISGRTKEDCLTRTGHISYEVEFYFTVKLRDGDQLCWDGEMLNGQRRGFALKPVMVDFAYVLRKR